MSWKEWKSDPTYYAREGMLVVFAVSLFSLTCVAAPIYILHGCYRSFFPSDRVTVEVNNIQPDVNFLCVVAETDDGPQALDWDWPGQFGHGSMHPSKTTISDPRYSSSAPFSHDVRWKSAKRYGVLTREEEDTWRIYWFTTDEAKLQGGTWKAHLPDKDKAETPSVKFLMEIGMPAGNFP